MRLRVVLVVILQCAVRFLHSAPLPFHTVVDLESNSLPSTVGEEGDYFEGDIRLVPGEDPYDILQSYKGKEKRQTILYGEETSGDTPMDDFDYAKLWPDHRIPYKFRNDMSTTFKETFREAIREWNDATCMRFTPAKENDTDYLLLTDQRGCSSFVGKVGGEQEVSISVNCSNKGHAMHELGHALGFWHEHSRPDRDSYIRINWANIKETKIMNFGILSDEVFRSSTDVGYDIESVMHYGPYAFSVDSKNPEKITIRVVQLPPGVSPPECRQHMGQRTQLSYLDKLRASYLYQCTDHITGNGCPTITPPTTPPPPRTINTDTELTVRFVEGDLSEPAEAMAIECFSSSHLCKKQECLFDHFDNEISCDGDQKFVIQLTEERKNTKIKSADTVVMRSVHRAYHWIDCSSGQCTITECSGNEVNPNISTNFSDCNKHFLVVYAINKRDGKPIRISDEVVFKHSNRSLFLNCQEKTCQMVYDPDCLTRDRETADESQLVCQKFSLHKE